MIVRGCYESHLNVSIYNQVTIANRLTESSITSLAFYQRLRIRILSVVCSTATSRRTCILDHFPCLWSASPEPLSYRPSVEPCKLPLSSRRSNEPSPCIVEMFFPRLGFCPIVTNVASLFLPSVTFDPSSCTDFELLMTVVIFVNTRFRTGAHGGIQAAMMARQISLDDAKLP